ncbi:hypothetical protein SVAN01_02447 [Stagonosporopsis vannaccii]|nr:hypothetical protein SVAN01_02447 [Stagonosporopsis vannaccii]
MSLELESKFVKRGVWTNLDEGAIMGQKITTDTRTGSLIVALLAVLSAIGTTHLWHLVTFMVHQMRANGKSTDALFRQQQALLRTLPAPSAVMTDTIKLWWAWRRRANRPLLRSLVLFLVALLFVAASGAASVFSSLVVDSRNLVVLVDSPDCGWASTERIFAGEYVYPVKAASTPYAGQCYTASATNATLPAACNVLVQRELSFETRKVPCPLGDDVCQETPGIEFDTGFINVGPAFGLDLSASDAVKFRKRTTCGILAFKRPYVQGVLDSIGDNGQSTGNVSVFPRSLKFQYGTKFPNGTPNTTFGLDLNEAYYLKEYTLHTFYNYSNPKAPVSASFSPIEELKRENSTLVLIYVGSNSVSYNSPVKDPFFNATQPVGATFVNAAGQLVEKPVYISNHEGQFMGCQDQYQFCFSRAGKEDYCTDLNELPLSVYLGDLPLPANIDFSKFPGANGIQRTILRLLATSSYAFNMATVPTDLLAGSFENPDREEGLPDDQWIRELTRWQRQILASLQVAFLDYAIGPRNRDTAAGVHIEPENEFEKQLCGMQKMRKSGDVVNINVFGFSFIVAVSVFFAILDITILRIMIYLTRFRRALGLRIDRWIQDGVWQLQRRAYEGEGYCVWTDLEADVPLTDERKLKDLPVLRVPRKSPALRELDFSLDPAVNYGEGFRSTLTVETARLGKTGAVQTEVESVDTGKRKGLGIFRL